MGTKNARPGNGIRLISYCKPFSEQHNFIPLLTHSGISSFFYRYSFWVLFLKHHHCTTFFVQSSIHSSHRQQTNRIELPATLSTISLPFLFEFHLAIIPNGMPLPSDRPPTIHLDCHPQQTSGSSPILLCSGFLFSPRFTKERNYIYTFPFSDLPHSPTPPPAETLHYRTISDPVTNRDTLLPITQHPWAPLSTYEYIERDRGCPST